MAQDVLLFAVAKHLRDVLNLTERECDVMASGQPKPSAGDEFIAVHEGSWLGQSADYDLTEVFAVSVTISRKSGKIPADQQGKELLHKPGTGLSARCRQVIVAVHMGYANIINAANDLAENTAGVDLNGIIEPLRLSHVEPSMERMAEWWFAEPPPDGGWEVSGWSRTVVFGEARRVQTIGEMK